MAPTLIFSQSDDAARIELHRRSFDPILACVLEQYWPASSNFAECLMFFVQTDTLFLNEETSDVFSAIEEVCRKIVAGEVSRFSPLIVETTGFQGYIDLAASRDGILTAEVRSAAHEVLIAFASQSDYWPPRKR